MAAKRKALKQKIHLQRKIEELENRLVESEETLRAIREGEVDAIIVSGRSGEQVFSLFGAESIYRLIVETMKEAALTVAFDGKILYCNNQFSLFVKKQSEWIIGHALEEFVSHDSGISMSSMLIAAREEPVKQRLVFHVGDGTTAPALISTNVLDQPDGMSFCIVVSDLTELENSTELIQQLRDQKEALHQSEERLRVATESAEAGMWSVHIPSGRWEFSPQAARLFGLPGSGPITLEQIRERTHPDERDRLAEQSARSFAVPGLHELEYRVIHPDGTVHWVMLRGRTDCDDNGRPLRNMGVVFDITPRKRAEVVLRESEEKYRTLFESMKEGFCIIEMIYDHAGKPVDWRYLAINPAAKPIFGFDPVGKTVREFVPKIETFWFNFYSRIVETGEPAYVEERVQGRWFRISATRMREAGAVYYLTKSGPSDVLIQTIRACMKAREQRCAAAPI